MPRCTRNQATSTLFVMRAIGKSLAIKSTTILVEGHCRRLDRRYGLEQGVTLMHSVLYALILWLLASVPVAFFIGRVCRLNELSCDDEAGCIVRVRKAKAPSAQRAA